MLVITNPHATVNVADVIYYGLMQRRRLVVNTAFNYNTAAFQLTAL